MLTALIALAGAAECEPLGSERFRSLVLDSQAALDRGDLPLLKTVLSEVDRDVPCMDFAPPPRLWADLMAVFAVANFADGKDWESPLAAALRIRPGIDRGVGRSHPIYAWEPPAPGFDQPYAGEATLYVDGREAKTQPPEGGWYLIQKNEGDFWETYWQREAPAAAGWVEAPIVRPPEIFYQLSLGLHLGGVQIAQDAQHRVDGSWQDYKSRFFDFPRVGGEDKPTPFVRPAWGIEVKGRALYERRIGVSIAGNVLWNVSPGMRFGKVSAIYSAPRVHIGAGLSFFDIFLVQREDDQVVDEPGIASTSAHLERFYHGEVGVRMLGPVTGEATLLVGARGLSTFASALDLTFTFENVDLFAGLRPQIGGSATLARGVYRAADEPALRLDSLNFRASTHLTLLFGKRWTP